MPISEVGVNINLPFVGSISGKWTPNEASKNAAWDLAVELSTRVATVGVSSEEMGAREALSSLYGLMETTRGVLKTYGPEVAQRPRRGSDVSFGSMAVQIVNGGLRPVLTKWHPKLTDHEEARPEQVTPRQWEMQWSERRAFHADIASLQTTMLEFLGALADGAGVERETLGLQSGREARRSGPDLGGGMV